MTPDQTAAGGLLPELEAIAAAAHERLTAQAGEDLRIDQPADDAERRVAGGALERDRRRRTRRRAPRPPKLGDMLRQVTRAAKRKREADPEYEQAIARAGRLGLSHREIATAAEVSHGTIRAILTRAHHHHDNGAPAQAQPSDREPDEIPA